MYLDQAKARFLEFCQTIPEKYKPASPYVAVPSSEAEIKAMEKTLNLSFPAAYQEFLLWMGKDVPSFMDCYVFALRTLPRNREDALELMEENESTELLPADAIVFAWFNQGQGFGFIRASEGGNPPVSFYVEGKGMIRQTHPNLEAFVIGCMDTFLYNIAKVEDWCRSLNNG